MKFRKKPVVIEATQWTGTNVDEVLSLSMGSVSIYRKDLMTVSGCIPGGILVVETLEGDMQAHPGDWIIKGVKGECYPCRSDIFEVTYEAVYE